MLSLVQAKNDLQGIESVPWRDRFMRGFLGTTWEVSAKNKANIYRSQREALHAPDSVFTYLTYPDTLPNNMTTTQAASSMLTVARNTLLKEVNSRIERLSSVEGFDPSKFNNLGSAAGGKDLTGFNRDRRALEIHFHDKLVEWNSTIKTDDPQQVVNEVADTMDQLVAAAIQQALLGSTDKMATRF